MNDETVSKKENDNENDNELNNDDKLIEKSKTEYISQEIKQSNKQNNNKDKMNILIENLMNVNNDENSEHKKSIENNFENNENKKNVNFKNYHCDSDIDLSYSIISLDIDGNVNLYQYGKENTF